MMFIKYANQVRIFGHYLLLKGVGVNGDEGDGGGGGWWMGWTLCDRF